MRSRLNLTANIIDINVNRCRTGKRVYLTQEIAEEALIGARINYKYPENTGPVGVYQCEECGFYHLTSKGPMNERLAKYMAEGKIRRSSESEEWLRKLRKR